MGYIDVNGEVFKMISNTMIKTPKVSSVRTEEQPKKKLLSEIKINVTLSGIDELKEIIEEVQGNAMALEKSVDKLQNFKLTLEVCPECP